MEIFTNSNIIDTSYPARLYNRVPDSLQRERSLKNELRVRCYYEAKRCFDSSGFVLFDTLTYDDYDIPHYNDLLEDRVFSCWDYPTCKVKDLQDFFKRLRFRLDAAGYPVEDSFRYLAVSEYGDESKTMRPHYHLVLFVDFPIDAITLSSYISASWPFGKTDGVRPHGLKFCSCCKLVGYCRPNQCLYQSPDYVLSNRVFSTLVDINKLCNYVLKYVTKNFVWINRLQRRMDNAFSVLYNTTDRTSKEGRLLYRRFKRNIMPFRLCSNGFGVAALDYLNRDELLNSGVIRMPLNQKGDVMVIPLPQYYKRKLLYRIERSFDRKYKWLLKFSELSKVVDLTMNKIRRTAYKFVAFDHTLDYRTALVYARYDIVYKGTVAPAAAYRLPVRSFISDFYYSKTFLRYPNNRGQLPANCLWQNYGDLQWSPLELVKYPRRLYDGYRYGRDVYVREFRSLLPSGIVYADDLPEFRSAQLFLDCYYEDRDIQYVNRMVNRIKNDSYKIRLYKAGLLPSI